MEQQVVTLVCRSCGKSIQIPKDLDSFACLYCGERMTMAQMCPKTKEPVGVSNEADFDYVNTHLVDCFSEHEKFLKFFTQKAYEPHFFQFKRDIMSTYAAMDRYVQANPARADSLLQGFACRLLDDRETFLQTKRLWNMKKSSLLFESKLLMALFLVPAVLDLQLSISEEFVKALHTEYTARYPKDGFSPATYEQIASGFRSRKLCFITTAVCEFEGKPDNCAELQAFRGFRDNWLSGCEDGADLITEYYRIAPAIVTVIDYCDDREAVYDAIRKNYLTPCYEALKKQDYPRCKTVYTQMVRELQTRYGLS